MKIRPWVWPVRESEKKRYNKIIFPTSCHATDVDDIGIPRCSICLYFSTSIGDICVFTHTLQISCRYLFSACTGSLFLPLKHFFETLSSHHVSQKSTLSCKNHFHYKLKTSCAGGRHNNMPIRPLQVDLWPWKWCPSHVTWATSVPILGLCSRFRPNVRDRQPSVVRRASSLTASAISGLKHNNSREVWFRQSACKSS